MKKYFYLLCTLLIFTITSCQKETSTCYYHIRYYSFGFAFIGFTPEEVDTLILKTYEPGTGFSNLLHTDTIYTVHQALEDGIIYRDAEADSAHDGSGSGFGKISIGSDYILEIPALQSLIKIKEITQGPVKHTFQVDGRCSAGSGQTRYSTFEARFESSYNIIAKKGSTWHPDDNIALIRK